MKASIIATLIFSIFLFGCNNSSKKTIEDNAAEVTDSIAHHHEAHADEQVNGVTLDDGKKWITNAETTQGINTMIALVNNLPANASIDDYDKLRVKLDSEFNMILQKCTMTGEAHNQLHNYLLPMKELFEKLNSQDIEVCKSSFNILKKQLNEYQVYFQ